MINKLIEAVIQKHGPVMIGIKKTGHGDFQITTGSDKTKLEINCFNIMTGLINILKKENNGK